ncbi:velvet factor [Exophiala viscosa]|uniref:velvet factor n=1 Tax=Exophiala viscosa TaxID=2486360 RepID=UPI0021999563|nr:velvet factor [Exophiala viscosa]
MNTDSPAKASPQSSENENDLSNYTLPTPPPSTRIWGDLTWSLEVVQQPVRARMCGFGDKDRRPISPPPCIRLIIRDRETEQEIDYTKIADISKLILHVDLWNLEGTREDNCVKHPSQTSPNISSVVIASYPMVSTTPALTHQAAYPMASTTHGLTDHAGYPMASMTHALTNQAGYPMASTTHALVNQPMPRSSQDVTREGSVARNLIGSAAANAVKLDYQGEPGIWFVLQDLSVRTEGWFRLKFSLINLAELIMNDSVNKEIATNRPLFNEAPCLAASFSKPFKVFSAKKFPGVMETTQLSQAFAAQGIKIPIRRPDGKKRKAGGEGDEDGDGEDENEDDE